MNCRYDPKLGHLTRNHRADCGDGVGCAGCLPCEHDDQGREIRHCTGREGCTSHLGPGEAYTCLRCIGRVRANLRKVEELAALMIPDAIDVGIESEAANLAGRAAHPAGVREMREAIGHRIVRLPEEVREKARAAIPDEDPWHPYAVLGRWDMMLREDYGQPTVLRITVSRSRAYLDSILTRIAQDPEQDWEEFARDIGRCLRHLEDVHRDSRKAEKGAPCWLCEEPRPALLKRYGHWCNKAECDREHPPCEPGCTEAHEHDHGDWWACSREETHWWSDADYWDGVTEYARGAKK